MGKSTATKWLVNRKFSENHTDLARPSVANGNIVGGEAGVKRQHAVIFDFDGTLVDSLRDITAALNAALRELGRRPATRQQVRAWVGEGLPSLCRRALSPGDESAAETLVRRTKEHYLAYPARHTRPYPNILKMLDLLQAGQVPMAVLSNKPHDLTVRIVVHLGLAHYFAEVLGCRDGQRPKPEPDGALGLAQRLGLRPASTYLVGDSATDVVTARNAGMTSVAVTWGFRNREELLLARPDHVLSDPLALPILLTD